MLNSKKLLAAAAAGVMTLNTMGLAVFANEGDNTDWDVNINKTVEKDPNTVLPNENFEFEVSLPTNLEGTLNSENIPLFNGMAIDDITVTDPTTPNKLNAENISGQKIPYTGGKIQVKTERFINKPVGIYRYIISEKDGSYEDLTYSTVSYYVDVYVTNQSSGTGTNPTAAAGLKVTKADGTGDFKVSGMDFLNDYTKSTNPNIHNLLVTKIISGNQADMGAEFEFEVTINSSQSGEQYYWSTTGGDTGTATAGNKFNVNLSHNETLTVFGLSSTDTYEVNEVGAGNENEYGINGYKTTVVDSGFTATTDNTPSENAKVEVTNTRDGSVPTGIIMSAAPFAGMIGLGGIFAGLFFRKKRED